MQKLYLLDTDICSYIIKGKFPELNRKLISAQDEIISISVITKAELLFGVARITPAAAPQLELVVNEFLSRVNVEPWGGAAPECYAAIRANLQKTGQPIGIMDLLIVAHAVALDAILVTNNMRHFECINGLKTEKWLNN